MAELLDDATIHQLERLALPVLRGLAAGLADDRPGVVRAADGDFADYRRYVAGDDLRRVDWNVYARLRQLEVKLGENQGRLAVDVLLDTSRSMQAADGERLLHAQRIAATLGAVTLLGGDRARVVTLADGRATVLAQLDGPRALRRLLTELERMPLGRGTGLADAVADYRRAGAPADLVLLLTDANAPADDLRTAARGLSGAPLGGLVHVVAPDDLDTALRGSVEVFDSETGERIELVLDEPAAERYAELQRRFLADVEQTARGEGLGYVRALTTVPALTLLLGRAGDAYLRTS